MPKSVSGESVRSSKSGKSSSSKGKSQSPPKEVAILVEPKSMFKSGNQGPSARFPEQIQTASRENSASMEARKFFSTVRSMEDSFHVGLLSHVLNPLSHFSLPGIYMPGIQRSAMSEQTSTANGNADYDVVLPAGDGAGGFVNQTVDPKTAFGDLPSDTANLVRATVFPSYLTQRNVSGGDLSVGRYVRFHGTSVFNVSTTTDANGSAELWFFCDPSIIDRPVYVTKPFPGAVPGDYSNVVLVDNPNWTGSPYLLSKTYVSGNNDTQLPGPAYDASFLNEADNLYFVGGAMLQVETLNSNAFLSTSYQTRTGDNVPDRFVSGLTNLYDPAAPEVAYPLGFLDSPEMADGAISCYTGQQWFVGRVINPVFSSPGFQVDCALRSCWNTGAPFIRVLCRTTNNGVAGAGSVQFRVTFNSWNASSPSSFVTSVACPLETVPFAMPTWSRPLRTRGFVYRGKSLKSGFSAFVTNSAMDVGKLMPSSTPLQSVVLSNPVSSVKQASLVSTEKSVEDNPLNRLLHAVSPGGIVRNFSQYMGVPEYMSTPLGKIPIKELLEHTYPDVMDKLATLAPLLFKIFP